MDKVKILYVDDEHINVMLLKANLQKEYDVLTAECGTSGLDILNEHKDLKVVISDLKMPGMNGLEFIKRAKEKAPDMSFYMLSGYDITPEIQEAIDSGLIIRYFMKPFNMKEISVEIKRSYS